MLQRGDFFVDINFERQFVVRITQRNVEIETGQIDFLSVKNAHIWGICVIHTFGLVHVWDGLKVQYFKVL